MKEIFHVIKNQACSTMLIKDPKETQYKNYVHQTPAPLGNQSRHPRDFDHQPMQNLVCIFMSGLEKTHMGKNMSLSQEISNRVFRVRISWSQTMNPACAIPKLFCPSFHAMAFPIWCYRAIKLHKLRLSVPSPQDRLGCTCLAHGDFSDLRVLVSDKPCLLYSPKYVQYVSFSQNSVSEKKRRQGTRSDSVHAAPFTLRFPAGSWVTHSLYCTDSHQSREGPWAPSSHYQNMKMIICYFYELGSYEKRGLVSTSRMEGWCRCVHWS